MELLSAISPAAEMGAYERAWDQRIGSSSAMAKLLAHEGKRLSQVYTPEEALESFNIASTLLHQKGVQRFGTRITGTIDYPTGLNDDPAPIPFLYFLGDWDLVFSPCVSVIGTRNPSPEGLKRTRSIARWLVEHDVTVVSGLAKGIDTEAHTAAIEAGGRTIAVIGTPIHEFYPPENRDLQIKIATEHLVVSHVPVLRYEHQKNSAYNRQFFPERNRLMSALSRASIIVEAGETSGTRTQATAALKQGRKLIILDNVFQKGLSWPEKMVKKGAIRVRGKDELHEAIFGDSRPVDPIGSTLFG